MNTYRIALCQLNPYKDKGRSLEAAEEKILEAKKKGARLVMLPEMFNCPYAVSFFREYAEPVPGGPTCRKLSHLARSLKLHIVGGSLPEIDNKKVYNTSPVFGPDGRLIAKHRKIHLFDIALKSVKMRESDVLSRGDRPTVFKTPFGAMGLILCYDLRFPELFRLMLKQDVKAVLMPGAFTAVTGAAHWHLLLRTRAVDNQVYMAAASPARKHQSVYLAYGHSLVADPWGDITAEAGTREALVIADLKRDRLLDIRARLPLLKHRRTDIY